MYGTLVDWLFCGNLRTVEDIGIDIVLRHNPSSSSSPGWSFCVDSYPGWYLRYFSQPGETRCTATSCFGTPFVVLLARMESALTVSQPGQTRCTAPSSTSCSAATCEPSRTSKSTSCFGTNSYNVGRMAWNELPQRRVTEDLSSVEKP